MQNSNSSFGAEIHVYNLQHKWILERKWAYTKNMGPRVLVVEDGEELNGG